MNTKQKHLLLMFIIVLIPVLVILGGVAGFWLQLSPDDKSHLSILVDHNKIYIFISFILVVFIFGYIAHWMFSKYFTPLQKLAEDADILIHSEQLYPVETNGAKELKKLADVINKHASNSKEMNENSDSKIDQVKSTDEDGYMRQPTSLTFENSPLLKLKFVVFDLETTGLDPSGGDEIISLGAVRVINGKIEEGQFEQLIDPRRTISSQTTMVTGITSEMIKGKPTIDLVLPLFHKFCEGSVLVAHNAAFDIRFLQLKEKLLGIKFDNPLLDTLLLSASVHVNQDSHSLDAIASRFGLNIDNRHSALGDARVTAGILLKLIPILAAKGIKTLEQANKASQKTYYARIKY